jgi:5-methylcytosine-specific restriction endonuclease McrA
VEKLNDVTLDLLRDWLHRTSQVTIRPVLDPARTDHCDAHDPPDWMRETIILRDQRCVFPGCRTDARRCDLDHTTPYQNPAHGGPPGQTHLSNLAALCRRHHRAKTNGGWHYRHHPDATGPAYEWTSPHGHHYLTHPPARL